MKQKVEVKVGDKVHVLFRKYKHYHFIGNVFEVSDTEHGLPGTWVSLTVTGEHESYKRKNDPYVHFYIDNHYAVMVPLSDVIEVLE